MEQWLGFGGILLFIVLTFILAQAMAKANGDSLWKDRKPENWTEYLIDRGDKYLITAALILGVVLGIGALIFKLIQRVLT